MSSGSTEDVASTGRSDKERLVPNKGMASDTWGKVSATRFRNTVNESKMVTPATEQQLDYALNRRALSNLPFRTFLFDSFAIHPYYLLELTFVSTFRTVLIILGEGRS